MDVTGGNQFDTYEILNPLGEGGLGQVFKARDTLTGRVVALTVLSKGLAGDPLAWAQFEREARTIAALDDPNLAGILDFAKHAGLRYVVTDLLEGESLQARLARGSLSVRKAVALATQIAQGLAAAHEAGVLHRDLTPAKVWITPEGRVKLLAFGLGRLTVPGGEGEQKPVPEGLPDSLAYMSPERIRGEGLDARSDVFSFGALLYEMATGRRAFRRATAAETRSAILHEAVLGAEAEGRSLPPTLWQLLDRCLDKEPDRRWRDAHYLAFALANLATTLERSPLTAPFAPKNRRTTTLWAALGACLLLGAAFTGWRLRRQTLAPAKFHLLNCPVGTLEKARFGSDGQTVYYSVRLAGGAPELFSLSPHGSAPRSLGLHDAMVLAISPTDELAVLQSPTQVLEGQYVGTLTQVPGEGGAQRTLREGVAEALWDRAGLVTVISDGLFRRHLDFPAGKTIATWEMSVRSLDHFTLSQDGDLLACVDVDSAHQLTTIKAFRRAGGERVFYRREGDGSGGTFTGLVWGPGGELWVSELEGDQTVIWILSQGGGRRVLWRNQGHLQLLDVTKGGRALLAQQTARRSVCSVKPGGGPPVDLSIQARTQLRGISDDGQRVLLNESPVTDGNTLFDWCFVRSLEGGPPLVLGRGWGNTISSDGRWVQVDPGPLPAKALDPAWAQALLQADQGLGEPGDARTLSRTILFVPIGAGHPFTVTIPKDFEPTDGFATLFPDGQRVLVNVMIKGREAWVVLDRRGAPPIQATPPDGDWPALASLYPLSPDGTRLIISSDVKTWSTLTLAGGRREPIQGLLPGERVLGWGADGASVFVRTGYRQLPVVVTRLDLRTGVRKALVSFSPLDPAGFIECRDVFMTPDARACVLSYQKKFTDLYVVDNLASTP